jgi:hypothetical protein
MTDIISNGPLSSNDNENDFNNKSNGKQMERSQSDGDLLSLKDDIDNVDIIELTQSHNSYHFAKNEQFKEPQHKASIREEDNEQLDNSVLSYKLLRIVLERSGTELWNNNDDESENDSNKKDTNLRTDSNSSKMYTIVSQQPPHKQINETNSNHESKLMNLQFGEPNFWSNVSSTSSSNISDENNDSNDPIDHRNNNVADSAISLNQSDYDLNSPLEPLKELPTLDETKTQTFLNFTKNNKLNDSDYISQIESNRVQSASSSNDNDDEEILNVCSNSNSTNNNSNNDTNNILLKTPTPATNSRRSSNVSLPEIVNEFNDRELFYKRIEESFHRPFNININISDESTNKNDSFESKNNEDSRPRAQKHHTSFEEKFYKSINKSLTKSLDSILISPATTSHEPFKSKSIKDELLDYDGTTVGGGHRRVHSIASLKLDSLLELKLNDSVKVEDDLNQDGKITEISVVLPKTNEGDDENLLTKVTSMIANDDNNDNTEDSSSSNSQSDNTELKDDNDLEFSAQQIEFNKLESQYNKEEQLITFSSDDDKTKKNSEQKSNNDDDDKTNKISEINQNKEEVTETNSDLDNELIKDLISSILDKSVQKLMDHQDDTQHETQQITIDPKKLDIYNVKLQASPVVVDDDEDEFFLAISSSNHLQTGSCPEFFWYPSTENNNEFPTNLHLTSRHCRSKSLNNLTPTNVAPFKSYENITHTNYVEKVKTMINEGVDASNDPEYIDYVQRHIQGLFYNFTPVLTKSKSNEEINNNSDMMTNTKDKDKEDQLMKSLSFDLKLIENGKQIMNDYDPMDHAKFGLGIEEDSDQVKNDFKFNG